MSVISLCFIALAMSTDAFAVAIGKGSSLHKPTLREALRTGVIFSLIKTVTPLVGWAIGQVAARHVTQWDHWIAFVLLVAPGLHMVYNGVKGNDAEDEKPAQHSFFRLALTAFATSVDALAVGVGLAFVEVNILVAASAIGVATLVMVTVGVMLGRVLGAALGRRAEIVGGVVLMLVWGLPFSTSTCQRRPEPRNAFAWCANPDRQPLSDRWAARRLRWKHQCLTLHRSLTGTLADRILEFSSMPSSHLQPHDYLSPEERSAIAEIEATTSILRLVTRLTGMRFAGIAKFTDTEWITCMVHDVGELGIEEGDCEPLEVTLCSEFKRDPRALLVPRISEDERFATRPVVKRFDLESYAGVPIFLPDGRLYGALCALDSEPTLFDNPDLAETLDLFARLIGCIFYANLAPQPVPPVAQPA